MWQQKEWEAGNGELPSFLWNLYTYEMKGKNWHTKSQNIARCDRENE